MRNKNGSGRRYGDLTNVSLVVLLHGVIVMEPPPLSLSLSLSLLLHPPSCPPDVCRCRRRRRLNDTSNSVMSTSTISRNRGSHVMLLSRFSRLYVNRKFCSRTDTSLSEGPNRVSLTKKSITTVVMNSVTFSLHSTTSNSVGSPKDSMEVMVPLAMYC